MVGETLLGHQQAKGNLVAHQPLSQETWIQVSTATELQNNVVVSLSEPQFLCVIWFSAATVCWEDGSKGKWAGLCCLRLCFDKLVLPCSPVQDLLSKLLELGCSWLACANILPSLQESDTDLEVVLEKRGNMDETCIDQVGPSLSCVLPYFLSPPGTLTTHQATNPWARGFGSPKVSCPIPWHTSRGRQTQPTCTSGQGIPKLL